MLLSTRYRRVIVSEMLTMATFTREPPSLGSIPLTVITAGAHTLPGWGEMQAELAALSSDAKHIMAEGAGHYVQLDDPDLVTEAIEDLVRRVRAG
jgi:pimeloyl-ACP methyl ester carboxylesterase